MNVRIVISPWVVLFVRESLTLRSSVLAGVPHWLSDAPDARTGCLKHVMPAVAVTCHHECARVVIVHPCGQY